MAVDDHVPVPKKGERSIIGRKNKEHQTNCQSWLDNKHPWNCAAHHILPVTCFNPVKCTPKNKANYIYRCLYVSQWNINGGNKFSDPKGANNMVRLPTMSAYTKRYRSTLAKFKAPYPVNECSHSGTYGEHYRYNIEVNKWLEANVWSTLQEDKAKHKLKGKDIKGLLTNGHNYFRGQLLARGSRPPGTINGWLAGPTNNLKWALPFSMAANAGPGAGDYCTKHPI